MQFYVFNIFRDIQSLALVVTFSLDLAIIFSFAIYVWIYF